MIISRKQLWFGIYRLIRTKCHSTNHCQCHYRSMTTSDRIFRSLISCSYRHLSISAPILPTTTPKSSNIDRDQLKVILFRIRGRSPIDNVITDEELINLPDLCHSEGLYTAFAKTFGKWFDLAKRSMDRLDHINAPWILRQIGRINRNIDGDLMARISSWRPITYFMRRMIDIGLDRFPMEDLVRSLSGIHHLITYQGHRSYGPIEDGIKFRSTLDDLLLEFDKLLTGSISDQDYRLLIRRASSILFLLSHLIADRPPSTDLLRLLCECAKTNFDRKLGFGVISDHGDFGDRLQSQYYADALRRLLVDPETFVTGSWNSWYDFCAKEMADEMGYSDMDVVRNRSKNNRSLGGHRSESIPRLPPWRSSACADTPKGTPSIDRLTFGYAFRVVQITECFHSNPITSQNFWRTFPVWRNFTRSALIGILTRPQLDDRRSVPAFIYNFGRLSILLRQDNDRSRDQLQFALPILDEVMSRIGVGCNFQAQARALTGFRDLKRGLDADRFVLSDRYFDMLREWCAEIRLDDKNRLIASDQASAVMSLLRDIETYVPDSVVQELCQLFRWGFNPDDSVLKTNLAESSNLPSISV